MGNIIKKVKRKYKKLVSGEFVEPGHFYSVIPDLEEIKKKEDKFFHKQDNLTGINLNKTHQMDVLNRFMQLKEEEQFYSANKRIRFNIDNNSFSYDDAPILHYMIRDIKPKRIIEIGSGNSSACMLDTIDNYINYDVKCTFVDVDCTNLKRILLPEDYRRISMVEDQIQNVDLSIFKTLQENDLLFVDSSHVLKLGSDLYTIIFRILPILNPGVYIHFHDIRFPFEYSRQITYNRIFWNEAYFLRAFLQNNDSYSIHFWLNFLVNQPDIYQEKTLDFLPLSKWADRFNNGVAEYSDAGGSIYLRKNN